MPLVVQRRINVRIKGHLSNERRVCQHARHWVVEIEGISSGKRPLCREFKLRKQIEKLPAERIRCGNEEHLEQHLEALAAWACADGCRRHFEWVWDGKQLWIVQCDVEPETKGKDPCSRWNGPLLAPSLGKLRVLVEAGEAGRTWKKIQSLQRLRVCGLPTAKIFVLESESVNRDLSRGKTPAELRDDLSTLLQVPIVIRTDIFVDGTDFPALSPRSPTVSRLSDALRFLKERSKEFVQSGLRPGQFAFLMHHFIPARSGAYSLSRPDSTRVRIDSTWGLPDGLLAYPYDSFEIDCRNPRRIQRHLRCKTDFVGVADNGDWVGHPCAPAFDWQPSLTDGEIREIAQHSLGVSKNLRRPVEIMFFVGVDARSGHPTCLPWLIVDDVPDFDDEFDHFHYSGKSVLVDTEAAILAAEAWIGQERQHGKVYLKLRPRVELLRSNSFVERVARLARTHDVPVELEGSMLQHIYYMLRKAGVRVRCVEAFRARRGRKRFGKLVRDLVPVIIESLGEKVQTLRIPKEELFPLLKAKALEESLELLAESDPLRAFEELADLLEVLRSACTTLDRKMEDLERVADAKRKGRGGFDEGIVLLHTEEVPLVGPQEAQGLFAETELGSGFMRGKFVPGTQAPKLRKEGVNVSLIPPVAIGAQKEFVVPLPDSDFDLHIAYKSKFVRVVLRPRPPIESPDQMNFSFMDSLPPPV